MELWDLCDENRAALNRTHERGKPVQSGEYHTVVEIWTINNDGGILVTLRDPRKEAYPNKWENTGGSALSGETSREAAVRELFEETGISASQEEVRLLKTIRDPDAFVDIYLLRRDAPISALTMQEGETVDAKWVSLAELDAMVADETLALPIAQRFADIRKELLEAFTAPR